VWLGILGLLALAPRALVAHGARICWEGCGYVMHAWSIARGTLTTPFGIPQLDHAFPPLYPALIALFHLPIASWPDAAKTVSVAFGALLVIPIFALARAMFSRETALLAAALTVAYPALVQAGSNAYAEPVALFCLALSMWDSSSGSPTWPGPRRSSAC